MKSNLQVFGLAIALVDANHMAGTLVLEFNSDIKALTLLQILIKQTRKLIYFMLSEFLWSLFDSIERLKHK